MDDFEAAKVAAAALEAQKADNVRVYDVRGKSNITDFAVAATGTSAPHLRALLREAEAALEKAGVKHIRVSGEPDSGWVVLDCFTVMVHIFSEEARTYYAIEKLWTGEEPPQDASGL